MKASELIKHLQELVEEHGDIEVERDNDFGDIDIYELPFSQYDHIGIATT